jgi:hypothetical protein
MSSSDGDEYYFGPSYEFTSYVTTLSAVPRFGHGSDFTTLFSPDQEAQLDYGPILGDDSVPLWISRAFVGRVAKPTRGSGSETNNLDAGMCTRVIVGIMKGGLMIFIHGYSKMEDDCP